MNPRSLLPLASGALLALPMIAAPAAAQSPTAEPMTCAQAIAFYERNRFIHVRANGRDVVPVRRGTPVNLARDMQCSGRGQMLHGYAVRTSDLAACTISMRC